MASTFISILAVQYKRSTCILNLLLVNLFRVLMSRAVATAAHAHNSRAQIATNFIASVTTRMQQVILILDWPEQGFCSEIASALCSEFPVKSY